ncbi:4F2 cell-surface antigen heavy chain-like [Myxocyprinus asiaticus]|uniref:4F2 cell-surface antigen heavy chain-like n=1 Tax=Myxocyprinus asiaticus TaxID=70543 RepID=UPI002221E66C|nr:4F2 cell-surface antigen heavy chain-like [Myxocyprinus asiaticus]XP_051576425.1 4F2 cell-surface antigen heavy chain-like [Myxocyprinus asiaticus]
MKDVELNKVDLEKQQMKEKNGCVKVTVQEDTGAKLTCLSKDELMKIAGTAGWIRARWILLVLFWLGWVGMLAGAVVIILQAPRCKPIPEMNWWNKGLLYQISDVNAFSDKGLKGVEEKLDYLKQMKVKGLVLGPIHTVQADQLNTLKLTSIKPEVGTENELETLLDQAHKKGISVVLDLTPNYESVSAWFNNTASVAEKLKEACVYWLNKGFNGISLSDLGDIAKTSTWPSIQDIINKTNVTEKTALIGSVTGLPVHDISVLLNHSGVDLLLTGLPDLGKSGETQALSIQELYSMHPQTRLGWSLSGRTLGCLASRTPAVPVRLFQTLLFTLPGTPVFNAGDEVGLKTGEKLKAMWDLESPADEANATAKTLQEERIALRDFFKALSDLRGKERALLHGEFVLLYSSPSALAFLRLWDQSERFLIAINWGYAAVNMTLTNSDLPAKAQVCVTTNAENLAVDSMVSLKTLELGAKQAVLLSYPYAG